LGKGCIGGEKEGEKEKKTRSRTVLKSQRTRERKETKAGAAEVGGKELITRAPWRHLSSEGEQRVLRDKGKIEGWTNLCKKEGSGSLAKKNSQ